MGISLLLDGFTGDPQALYNVVVEEINQRQLPDVEFGWAQEGDSAGFMKLKGAVTALKITFRGHGIHVLGFQVGRCFHVSARTVYEAKPDPHAGFLRAVALACFLSVVNQAVRDAVRRQLEDRQGSIPAELIRPSTLLEIAADAT